MAAGGPPEAAYNNSYIIRRVRVPAVPCKYVSPPRTPVNHALYVTLTSSHGSTTLRRRPAAGGQLCQRFRSTDYTEAGSMDALRLQLHAT